MTENNLYIPPVPISAAAMADLLCTMVVVCRGVRENGNPFWAYVCMKPSMAESFRAARESGIFNLEDYGTIVQWGEGEEIPADIEAKMAREYGTDPDYESKLIAALEAKNRSN